MIPSGSTVKVEIGRESRHAKYVGSWRLLGLVLLVGSCGFENDSLDPSVPPTVGFEFSMSGADEMSGTVMIPIVLSRQADAPVTVTYSLLNANTATPGVDFDLMAGTVTFGVGDYRKEVPVTIKNDFDETESVETFDIAITAATGASLDETRAIHEVRIADHILPRVAFDPTPTQTSEGAPTTLVIHLDKPSEGESTVVVGVNGIGAAPTTSADLTLLDNTTVTIPNGATQVSVAIGEKDDPLDEEDLETVEFTLRGASTNLVLGTQRTLEHVIADNDDPPVVRFKTASSSLNEANATVTMTVELTAASGRLVTIDYGRDAADTADDADATVSGSPGTLTFNPGELTKTITCTVAADTVDEDNETVLVNLSNAVHATLTTATYTLTINDNDTASVRFAKNSDLVDEDSPGGISVTVQLTTTSSKIVTVPFAINTGMTNATDNDDFVIMTASPLVFMPGETTKTIDIDVPENSPGNESNERLVLDLQTPTNSQLTSPTRYTLTITE